MSEEALQVVILIFLGIPVPIAWMIKKLLNDTDELNNRKNNFD